MENITKKILVTDTKFIFEEHIQQIESAGYQVERLNKLKATEDELIEALQDKVGYILGGIEEVTEKVIQSSSKLKVISFTGAGYDEFIPGYKAAKERGIAITAAKGANSDAVAEFALTLALMATRRIPEITNPDGPIDLETKGATESTIGIVGYGDIGRKVAILANLVGFSVLVSARHKIDRLPANVRQVDIETLVKESDVVSLHVNKKDGTGVLNEKLISMMKSGSAIVNAAFIHAFDQEAVARRMQAGEVRLLSDQKLNVSGDFPLGFLVQTNMQSGYNTFQSLKLTSDQTTNSLLNTLENGDDDFRVI